MPKGPKGRKCLADVIGNAVKVMRIDIGEAVERSAPIVHSVEDQLTTRR